MIQFDHKRDLMSVFAGYGTQDAECGSYRIASPFNCQSDNIFRVEIDRVRSKGCTGGMFDILIYRQDRDISRVCQPSVS